LNHFPSAAEASLTRTQLAGMFLLLSFWSLKNWSCDPLSHILRGWYSSSKYSVHRCIVQGNTSQWWKKFTKHDNLQSPCLFKIAKIWEKWLKDFLADC
jgi:hypothetical protein